MLYITLVDLLLDLQCLSVRIYSAAAACLQFMYGDVHINHLSFFFFKGEYETIAYDQETRLSNKHRLVLFHQLCDFAVRWRDIGAYLGFRRGELDTIEGEASLLIDAPKSWLQLLLYEWLTWAPGDDRGSTRYATLEGLKAALINCDLRSIGEDIQVNIEVDLGAVQRLAGKNQVDNASVFL